VSARASERLRNPLGAIYFPLLRATPTAIANRRAGRVREKEREGKRIKKKEGKDGRTKGKDVEGGKINV